LKVLTQTQVVTHSHKFVSLKVKLSAQLLSTQYRKSKSKKTPDVPGTTAGATAGIGALISSVAANGVDALYVTPAASINSGLKAAYDDAAMGAQIASMWSQDTTMQDLWLVAGPGLREHIVASFTRTAGAASQVDYNVNGPNCMPSTDRGYFINPGLLHVAEYQGIESENYPFLGGSYKGAVDTRYALMTTGPNGLGKVQFSDEA
jgi:hypothetical protein